MPNLYLEAPPAPLTKEPLPPMRKFLALSLVLLLLTQSLWPVLALAAEREQQVRVTGTTLNIRSGPGTDRSVVTAVSKGTLLVFLQQDGDWIKVRLSDDREGWASSKFLEFVEAAADEDAPPPRRDDEEERETPREETRRPQIEDRDGGGSALGGIFKWGCLLGGAAMGGLAFAERGKGNDAYDEYKALTNDGDLEEAEVKFEEAEDHDSKAQTFAMVGGGLFGLFLLQQFVFGGGDGDSAQFSEPALPPLALDPRTGEWRASLVLARF